jgi:hypothetical protein
MEKSKQKRSKRLNLIREEDNGPQFFTPLRVAAALDYQSLKEDKEEALKQAKIDNKARKALEKEEKEAKKKEAREERLRKRIEAQSEKARKVKERTEKAIEKRALKEAQKSNAALDKARKEASLVLNKASKASKGKRKLVESNIEVESLPVAKRVIATNSHRRAILIPARYA